MPLLRVFLLELNFEGVSIARNFAIFFAILVIFLPYNNSSPRVQKNDFAVDVVSAGGDSVECSATRVGIPRVGVI